MEQKKKIIGYDSGIINAEDDLELTWWSDKLDVTKVKLKAAINAVGNSAKQVEAYLRKAKR
jgi:hypothetical protein